MKIVSTALVLGLMCSTAAFADGDAMKSNTNAMSGSAMSGNNAMSNTNAMSGTNAMASKPAKKPMKKKPAKTDNMMAPSNSMSGSGDSMAAPKPH